MPQEFKAPPPKADAPEEYPIRKGIPIPLRMQGAGAVSKYRFDQMEVGDAKFIPEANAKSARATVIKFGQRKGWTFVTRKWVENGVTGLMIWRDKDKETPK